MELEILLCNTCLLDFYCTHPGFCWSCHWSRLLGSTSWQLFLVPLWWRKCYSFLPGLPEFLGLHHCAEHHGAHLSLCQVSLASPWPLAFQQDCSAFPQWSTLIFSNNWFKGQKEEENKFHFGTERGRRRVWTLSISPVPATFYLVLYADKASGVPWSKWQSFAWWVILSEFWSTGFKKSLWKGGRFGMPWKMLHFPEPLFYNGTFFITVTPALLSGPCFLLLPPRRKGVPALLQPL